MEKRSKYVKRLRTARVDPTISLVYHDGSEEPFDGVLPELVDLLQIEMIFDGHKYPWLTPGGHRERAREPGFIITPRVRFGRYRPIGFISVFTKTSKMRAPSFSLPAGPDSVGGTCLAAGQPALVEDDALFICHGCYASTGNYEKPSTQLVSSVRRMAVIRGLANGTFVPAMTEAIRRYRSKPRKDDIKDKVDGKVRKVGTYFLDTNYVRLHDAGDVLWQPGYLEAWIEVANASRGVKFWMPTRDWALGSNAVRRLTRAVAGSRGNFVLRPSALHVGDPAPDVIGLHGGASVSYRDDMIEHGLAEYNCPAYDHEKDKSCQTARCRRCWTQPMKTVNYEPHGRAMSREQLMVAMRARRNPQPTVSLEEVYTAYLASPTANPVDDIGFEVFLARSNLYPASWSQEEWWDLLHDTIGLDGDETAAYLENVAEWQP